MYNKKGNYAYLLSLCLFKWPNLNPICTTKSYIGGNLIWFYIKRQISYLTTQAVAFNSESYKHALQLYKLFNSNEMSDDWISLNVQQSFNGRNERIQFFNISNYKVGRSLMVNRFKILNNNIDYSWFNASYETFKIKCKLLLL